MSAAPSAEFGPSSDPDTLIEQAQAHLQRERSFNLDSMLKAWEQGYIEAAMKLTRGNVSQAAKLLGINRTTLYSRMESLQKQYGRAVRAGLTCCSPRSIVRTRGDSPWYLPHAETRGEARRRSPRVGAGATPL